MITFLMCEPVSSGQISNIHNNNKFYYYYYYVCERARNKRQNFVKAN